MCSFEWLLKSNAPQKWTANRHRSISTTHIVNVFNLKYKVSFIQLYNYLQYLFFIISRSFAIFHSLLLLLLPQYAKRWMKQKTHNKVRHKEWFIWNIHWFGMCINLHSFAVAAHRNSVSGFLCSRFCNLLKSSFHSLILLCDQGVYASGLMFCITL